MHLVMYTDIAVLMSIAMTITAAVMTFIITSSMGTISKTGFIYNKCSNMHIHIRRIHSVMTSMTAIMHNIISSATSFFVMPITIDLLFSHLIRPTHTTVAIFMDMNTYR